MRNGVKNMAESNMYSASAEEIWELFGDFVEGNPDGGALALSTFPLAADARNALERSLEAFGYGRDALAFVTLLPRAGASAGAALDAHAEFLLIEGIDPICLIACDERAIASLEAAYRTPCTRDAGMRVLGRPCVLLRDLSAMLASDQEKQRLWAILKTLPKWAGR